MVTRTRDASLYQYRSGSTPTASLDHLSRALRRARRRWSSRGGWLRSLKLIDTYIVVERISCTIKAEDLQRLSGKPWTID